MRDVRAWRRVWWGVVVASPADERRTLAGEYWHDQRTKGRLDEEPLGPLLFTTRQQARDWCATMQLKHQSSSGLQFRPVKVRETVTPA